MEQADLRVDIYQFVKELLRDEGKTACRLDDLRKFRDDYLAFMNAAMLPPGD